LVGEPFKHRERKQYGRLHAIEHRNGNNHGDLNSRFDQIWVGDRDGERSSDNHFGSRHVFSRQRPNRPNQPMLRHGIRHRQLQPIGELVCECRHNFERRLVYRAGSHPLEWKYDNNFRNKPG
jgi:hypothetical protein